MKSISTCLFTLLFLNLPWLTHAQANKCAPKLDGFVGEAAVYRNQFYDTEIKKCIPDISSWIAIKDSNPKKGLKIDGFVVGIENLWNNQLEYFYKFTLKAGANTTVVKLLNFDNQNKKFSEIPGATFASSMAAIDFINTATDQFEVKVLNGSSSGNCSVISEETFSLVNKQFQSKGKKEVGKVCK